MKPAKTHKYLIVVGGPTASGKTDFAVALARHYQTEIISCDSRQFYAEMSIGTAKPEQHILDAVPHHFIGHKSIQDQYSIGEFEKEALETLQRLFEDKDVVVATGGSGMYVKALCEGLDDFPEVSPQASQAVNELYKKEGLQALQQQLLEADPEYYQQVDLNNPSRLIRALGVCLSSGKPFSSFRAGQKAPRHFHCIYLQLVWPRNVLYDRINQRVDMMMQQGLEAEARDLLPWQYLNALQTVGYQELFDYFNKKITFEEATNLIKQNSRRYAKRQLTWMRRDGFWKKIKTNELHWAIDYIEMVRTRNGALIIENKPTGLIIQQKQSLPPMAIISWQNQADDAATPACMLIWKDKDKAIIAGSELETNPEDTLFILHEAVLWAETTEVFYCCNTIPAQLLPERLPYKTTQLDHLPEWSRHYPDCESVWRISPFE